MTQEADKNEDQNPTKPDQIALPLEGVEVNELPEEPWVTDAEAAEMRNYKWREVIDDLMNGAKITDAYAKAYDIEVKIPSKYNVAASNGSRLLRNAKFKELWRKVLEERGFSDEMADWQLTDLMTNKKYEPGDRFRAIKHFNELRGRVIKNIDLKSGGKPIEAPAIMPAIEPRNDATTEAETTDGS